VPAVTAAQMREVDRLAVEGYGIQLVQMMELAGRALAEVGTGECHEPCVRADATLTLALPKTGLLAPAARGAVGTLYLADIGIPPRLYERLGLTVGPIFERGGIVRLDDDGCIRARPVQRS
jgi:hypothetical protein